MTTGATWEKVVSDDVRIGFLAAADHVASQLAAGTLPAAQAAVAPQLIFNQRLDAVLAIVLTLILWMVIADTARVWCFGGRNGAASGHTITRAGELMKYEKTLHSEAASTLLRRDAASADSVFAALERIRFRSLRFNEISNMTCVLELNDGSGKHTVSWPQGQPPAAIQPVLVALARAFGDDRGMWP